MEKKYVTLIDGEGEKYEVIDNSGDIVTVKIFSGAQLNIPRNYLVDYNTWLKKNKKRKKS